MPIGICWAIALTGASPGIYTTHTLALRFGMLRFRTLQARVRASGAFEQWGGAFATYCGFGLALSTSRIHGGLSAGRQWLGEQDLAGWDTRSRSGVEFGTAESALARRAMRAGQHAAGNVFLTMVFSWRTSLPSARRLCALPSCPSMLSQNRKSQPCVPSMQASGERTACVDVIVERGISYAHDTSPQLSQCARA